MRPFSLEHPMPRNGAGGYSRHTPGTPYVAGTTIDESVVNAEMDDLGNEIANSLAADGQTVPTANLPMGGYKHTGVANGSARNHYAAIGQVQDNAFCTGTVGGTGDAITLTLSPGLAAYAAGQKFAFIATAANTGAATLNVNSLGAKAIKRDVSGTLKAGDIPNGGAVVVEYDGTNFQLINPATIGAITTSTLTMATARLLGRTTAGTGAPEEMTVGLGLSLSSGSLTVGAGVVVGGGYGEYTSYQRVSSVIPIDDTVPQSTEGTEIVSVSYTPTSSTNKIRLTASVNGLPSVTAAVAAVFSGTDCKRAQIFAHSSIYGASEFAVEFDAGTTSSTAYSLRVGVDPAGYVDLNADFAGNRVFGGKSMCTLKVEEIKV